MRTSLSSIVVTLGGGDTYGVTIKVLEILKSMGKSATVIIGPGFKHFKELNSVVNESFELKSNVTSLINEFSKHDLAITGGGITPFEANASGLPCIVIANELFEIAIGNALDNLGASCFIGHHAAIASPLFKSDLPLEAMSIAGINGITNFGLQNVIDMVLKEI